MSEADRLVASLRRHVGDERVLAALAAVPRDVFVPDGERERAWENTPLPIGQGQTISQPLAVAHMLELLELRGDERVLDVGTGSGYHAALLAHLAGRVWSVEVRERLAGRAQRALALAGVANVTCVVGDGALGLPAEAPFDAINVAAAGPESRLTALLDQLAPGGRMVAPVGEAGEPQTLVRWVRRDEGIERSAHGGVRFVALS